MLHSLNLLSIMHFTVGILMILSGFALRHLLPTNLFVLIFFSPTIFVGGFWLLFGPKAARIGLASAACIVISHGLYWLLYALQNPGRFVDPRGKK